jgi:hypothetical protein
MATPLHPRRLRSSRREVFSVDTISHHPPIDTQFDASSRYNILIEEMKLLQSRFDKYHDHIFRSRAWLMAAVGVLLAGALDRDRQLWSLFSLGVTALFFMNEVLWRSQWYKYVRRYRFIRDCLNTNQDIAIISLYDLTL